MDALVDLTWRSYPAALIMAVYNITDGTPQRLTTQGATLADGECAPTAAFAAGTPSGLSFNTANNADVMGISYITQAWADVFTNRVVGETPTVAADACTFANAAIAIEAVLTDANNVNLPIDQDDTVAAGELDIAFDASGDTTIDFFGSEVTTCEVAYIKKPSSGILSDNFVSNQAMTAIGNVCKVIGGLLIPGYSGYLPENAAVTEQMIDLYASAGAGECKLDYWNSRYIGHSITTGTFAGVWGDIYQLMDSLDPVEVPNGTDLSSDLSSVKVQIIGY